MSLTLDYRRIFPTPPDHDDGKIFDRKYAFQVQLTWEDGSRFIIPSYQMGARVAFKTAFESRKFVWPHLKKDTEKVLNALTRGGFTTSDVDFLESFERYIKPRDRDVIACLIRDAETLEGYFDVDDFASDLGFDTPTKAMAAWDECKRIRREFQRQRGPKFRECLMDEFGLTDDDL